MAELGLELGPEIGDWPGNNFAIGGLPDGWLLFMTGRLDEAFTPRFAGLSVRGPAVACSIEEHVMYQEARGYRDGAEIWRVTHDPNKGESLYHLDVAGDLPAGFDSMRAAAIKAQDDAGGEDAEVDLICDVPLDLAKSICGFKHDDDWPRELSFFEVRRARAARVQGAGRPRFFARLFGRG
ncbi:MAG: hypothetical protein ACHP7A_05365 [Caulobacterales bacterium]